MAEAEPNDLYRAASLRRNESGKPYSTISAHTRLIVPITYKAGVVLPVRSPTRPTIIGLTMPPSGMMHGIPNCSCPHKLFASLWTTCA